MAAILLWGCGMLLALAGCSAQQDATEIRQPPVITSPNSAVERFVNGKNPSNVTVRCQATGQPIPTYEWYRENVRLPGVNTNINVDERTGNMVVWPPTQTGLQPEDVARLMEGNYKCQAKTIFPGGSFAVAISDTVRITVVRVSQWTPAETDSKTATQGNYISIPCRNVPQTFGEVRFEWSGKVSEGAVIGDQIVPDARRFIDQTGTLHFIYAEPADSLYYLCGIKNAFQSEKSPIMTRLSVSGGTVSNVKPVLQGSSALSNLLTYEVGKTGYLECVFSGYDSSTAWKTPTIKWYDGAGQEIVNNTKYTVSFYGRFLEIRNLQESDEQQYKCEARNSLGTAEGFMNLNVTSKPMWDPNALRDVEVPEGRDTNLYCQTRSAVGELPPDPPRWYKNGAEMSPFDPTKYTFTADKKILTVMKPQKNIDIACFQCYVSNSVGTTFSSGCLNVVNPIVIVAKPEEVQSILTAMERDGIIDLTVVATADPLSPPIYEWNYKNRTFINNEAPPFVKYDANTKHAYINLTALTKQQQEAIAGVYSRRVYNRAMEIIVNVTVQYEVPPPNISTNETRHDVTCGETEMTFDIDLPADVIMPQTVTLSDPRCAVTRGPHRLQGQTALNACGTTVAFLNDSVVFSNEIFLNPDSSGTASGRVIPIHCRYNISADLRLSYLPIVRQVLFTEEGVGQFGFQMQQFQDAQYSVAVDAASYPLRTSSSQEIFVQLSLRDLGLRTSSGRPAYGMDVERCLASPLASVTDARLREHEDLILEGCPASGKVHLHNQRSLNASASGSDYFRFSFHGVTFSRDPVDPTRSFAGLVYVHCHVTLCPLGQCRAGQQPCSSPPAAAPGGVGGLRRRRAASWQSQAAGHQLSTGPLLVLAVDEASATSDNPAVIALSVVAAVACLAVVVVVVAWRRGARPSKGYQLVKVDEQK